MKSHRSMGGLVAVLAVTAALAGTAPATGPAGRTTVAATAAVAAEGGAASVLLLVDTSGSMDDKDPSGTVKIEGAKSALLGLLDGLPASMTVGLHTYPTDSNCGAGTTVLSGMGPEDPTLRAAITGLRAGGGTPTAQALRVAADTVIAEGRRATIVLVSDGESNCGADPCDVAKDVATQRVEITVNTVGFQISETGAKELSCIADATSGQYFYAGDSEALATAITDAATPRLSLVVEEPGEATVVGAGSVVRVTATVGNISDQRLDDVRTMLTFPVAAEGEPANLDPGVPSAIRLLGNLSPGESRRVRWQYRVPRSQDGLGAHIVVHAVAANASPLTVTRRFSYGDALTLSSAGPILREATHAAIMGDSYSAGEGSGEGTNYYPETKIPGHDMCHRSDKTYAMSLWERKPLILACSGARTENVDGPNPDNHEESQIDRLRAAQEKEPVDLVLLTLGGNDIGFEDIIVHCVLTINCGQTAVPVDDDGDRTLRCALLLAAATAATGTPVNEVKDCKYITYEQAKAAEIEQIGDDLARVYWAIDRTVNSAAALARRNGKIAPIIVLAYANPTPFRAGSTSQHYCSRFLSEADIDAAGRIADTLNAKIKSVVEQEHAKGLPIYFAADVADALRPGHTLCDGEPHVVREGLLRSYSQIGKITPGAFGQALQIMGADVFQEQVHPTADGYQDITAELVRWSNTADANQPLPARRDPAEALDLGPYAGPLDLSEHPTAAMVLQPASTITLQGGGFAPFSDVQIVAHSTPRVIGTAHADADGRITSTVMIPMDLPPGDHLLIADGLDADGRPHLLFGRLDVRRPTSWAAVTLGAISVLLLIAAVPAVVAWLRRRSSVAAAPVERPAPQESR